MCFSNPPLKCYLSNMSSVLQRLLHNLNLHSLLPSHRDSMVVVVGLGWCMTVLSLMWLSIYNKEWDITVIQPISSPSLLELFMKALVDIWIDLYLIKFQFLSILCVFCLPFTWRILHHRCTILSILIKSPRSGVTLCFQSVSATSAAAKTFPSHIKTVWAKPLVFGTKNIWVWGIVLDDLSMTLTQGHGCGIH